LPLIVRSSPASVVRTADSRTTEWQSRSAKYFPA
jgi:hypothetical protein